MAIGPKNREFVYHTDSGNSTAWYYDLFQALAGPVDKTTQTATSKTDGSEDEEPIHRRFWLHTFSYILVPPALTAYYIWTYVCFLQPSGASVSTAALDDRLVWWSWFVIGAIGLNVSTYMLASVEAGILTTRHFGALSSDKMAMHKDKSWSKISGWAHTVRHMFRRRSQDNGGPVLSLVWAPLFVLSVLSWAFVLNGLTTETRPLFKAGSVPIVRVVGSNTTNFDRRSTFGILEAAYQLWGQDQEPRIPFVGALYSMPDTPLSDFNITTGNSLPLDTNTPIFLAPKAETPVTGTTWGMAIRYSCRPIYKLADFKILSKRINSKVPGYLSGTNRQPTDNNTFALPPHYLYNVPGTSISVIRDFSGWLSNNMVAEVGISGGLYNAMDNVTRSYSAPYDGLDKEDILEVALWQQPPVDGIKGAIPELDREYSIFVPGISGKPEDQVPSPMSAIGAQCLSASATGNARVDGLAGTYTDFARQDVIGITEEDGTQFHMWSVSRFGKIVLAMFLPGVRGSIAFDLTAIMEDGFYGFLTLSSKLPWVPKDIAYIYIEAKDTFFTASNDWMVPLSTAGNVIKRCRLLDNQVEQLRQIYYTLVKRVDNQIGRL